MSLQKTIAHLKTICHEEAITLKIPHALIEVYLVKHLYSRKRERHLVSAYLKDCYLARQLKTWKGSFKVRQDKSIPTLVFKDGTEVAMSVRRNDPARSRWNEFIQFNYLTVMGETRDLIKKRVKERMKRINLVQLEYA